jgi:hypothetical protein
VKPEPGYQVGFWFKREESMRTTLTVLSIVAAIGVIACQNAVAFPIAGGAMQPAAASDVEHVQFAERHHHGRVTKCYREFVIGRYVCRSYRGW